MGKSKVAKILLFGWLILLVILHIYQDPPIGSVEGYIYEKATSEPIQDAKVYSIGATNKYVKTNQKGHFKLTGLVEGSYTVKAVKKGYDPSWSYGLRVKEKGEVPSVNLTLQEALPRFYMYSSKKVYTPKDKKIINLRGYNVDHVYLSIYKIDIESYVNSTGSNQNLNKIPLEDVKYVKKWDIDFGKEEEWASKETEVPISDAGVYLIKAWAKNSKNLKLEDTLWVNVTNLGLITKQSKTKLLVWAVDFKTHKPYAGVNIKIFSDKHLSSQGITDENGLFQKNYNLKDNFIFATIGGNTAFNYSSQSYYSNYKHTAYIYTERPIYRPNQTVYFKGIIRSIGDSGEYKLSPGEEVEVKIFDPKDNVVYEKLLKANDWGSLNDSFILDEEPPLGEYSIVFNINDEEYYGRFKVEEYRKPEFKVEVKPEKEIYIQGDKIKSQVNVSYYFGQPVVSAKVKYTVFSSYYYMWEGEEDYYDYFYGENYDDEYGYGYGKVISEGELKTDKNGIAQISVDSEKIDENRRYTIEVEVTDESERTITEAGSLVVMAGEFDLHLDSRSYVNDLGSTVNVVVEAKDADKKLINTDFEYEVIYSTSSYKNGRWVSNENRVLAGNGKTNPNGLSNVAFKVEKGGDYYFKAKAKDRLGNEIKRQLWFWVIDDKNAVYSKRNELKIQLGKAKYAPGETARALITTTEPNSYVLFTVEGKELYQAQILYLKGNSRAVEVPISDNYVPGMFLATSYVSIDNQFISEEKRVKVLKESKEIRVIIKPDKLKYLPNERAAYLIRTMDYRGKPLPSEVSLSVVDEAIYAIQPEMAGNIIDEFYGQVNNMVSTSYSFGTGYIGGISKFESSQIRRKFKDTAFWQANIYTNARGEAVVSFNFPENLTTWRATARAHTKSNLFGSMTQEVKVSKPLIARLELPRFFLTRDSLQITTVVHNYSDNIQDVDVKLKLEGVAFFDGKFYKEKSVRISKNSSQKSLWNLKVRNPGTAKITLWAGNKQISDGMELEIPVMSHGVKKVKYVSGSIVDRLDVTQNANTFSIYFDGTPDLKSVYGNIRISPTVASSLFSALDYLVGYPYGCVEQTMSRVLPNVFVYRALKEFGIKNEDLEGKLPQYIKKGIKRLVSYQHDDGGWGWWKNDETDSFMTAYAVYGLLISKTEGASVPEYILDNGLKSLEGQLKNFDIKNKKLLDEKDVYTLENKAYILYVLSNFRRITLNEASRLYEAKENLTPKALALLSIVLKRSGYDNRAGEIIDLLKSRAVVYQTQCYWKDASHSYYYDEDRNIEATAYGLLALLYINPENGNLDKIVDYLMSKRDGSYWVSTKTTSVVIQAFVNYIKLKLRKTQPSYIANVWVNGNFAGSLEVNESNALLQDRIMGLKKNYFKAGQNIIKIEKAGKGDLFYSLDVGYYGKEEDIKEKSDKRLSIKREFFKKIIKENPESEEIIFDYKALGNSMKLGDLVEVRLTIKNKDPLRYLVIEDPLLCGGEVLMDKKHDEWQYWFANREIRDEKAAFFITYLEPGEHVLEYEMRPELTGVFHIMPAVLTGMYEPKIYVYTKEDKFNIVR